MGYVSNIIKGQSTASKSGLWWQEEKLPAGENWIGKFKGCSHYGEGNYVKVWYNGNEVYAPFTFTDEYCRKNGLGKYANAGGTQGGAQGGVSAKPLSFKQKLFRVAAATVANGVLEADKQKRAGGLSGAKRVLPKPKAVRPQASTAPTTGLKKSLLSEKKVTSIAKARPTASATRSGLLSKIKSSPAGAKGKSIFGSASKPLAKKSGGLLGGAKAAPKRSGGLLGGAKATPKKSGGLLSGAKATPKKSGGLLGGGAKKSGSGLLGGAKKLGGGLGKKRR